MPVLAVLQRLVIPVILVAAIIGATVALDQFGNDPILEEGEVVDTAAAETAVFSLRRAPEMLTSEKANAELTAELDRWVATLPPNSCFEVSAGAESIYSHQPDLPLTPTSNMKILTAVAALQGLGVDYTYKTDFAARQEQDTNGLLAGNLFIIGGGDPLLMSDAYIELLPPEFSNLHSSIETMADQAVADNISDIGGAVMVDETRYDPFRAPAEIPQGRLDASQIGSITAGMLDQGFVGLKDGYASQDVVAGEDGVVPPPPPLPRSEEPAAEFAKNFDDLLEARNVRISSGAGVVDTSDEQLVTLFSFDSLPMSSIVEQMLTNGDNTTAEMIIKELGFVVANAGTTTAGTLAMSDILRGAGLNDAGLFALDGSGLSVGNTATCGLIHDTLNSVHKSTLRDALPVAGETGTIAADFIGTKGEGRIRAESGLVARASALSGYFVTDPGVELTFSLIINAGEEERLSREQVAGWYRPLPRILASYPSGPSLDELGPPGATDSGG